MMLELLTNKKNKVVLAILILGCIILSVLIEVFGFNFKNLTLDKNDQGIHQIDQYDLKTENENSKLSIKLDKKYVNKLVLNYHTEEDVPIVVKYNFIGAYEKEREEEVEDILNNELNSAIMNINQDITMVEFSYPKDKKVTIDNVEIKNVFNFNHLRFIFTFGIILTICLLVLFYRDGFKTEKLHIYLLVFGSIVGSLIIILQPAANFYSLDDQTHFERIIKIFGGTTHFTNSEYHMSDQYIGGSVGRDSVNSIEEQQLQAQYLDSGMENDYVTATSRLPRYDRLSYLPMAIGYHLPKLLGLPFTWCFKIGKLLNLFAYLLIMAYALKISKVGKRLLFVITFIPTSMFLASNYSYDLAVTSGVTLFLVSLINLLIDKKDKVRTKDLIVMAVAMFYACSAKAIYAPLLLLTLLIPKARFRNKKQLYCTKIGMCALCLFILLSIVATAVVSPGAYTDSRGGDTSASEQIKLIISHPLDYLSILKDTMLVQCGEKLLGMSTLGNWGYVGSLSKNMYFIFLIFIIFIGITDNNKNSLSKIHRFITIGTIIGVSLLIWTSLYVSFTPVGSEEINGVQARYFIPLLLPLILCLQSSKIENKIRPKIYNGLVLVVPLIVMFISVYQLILLQYCL